MKMKIRAIILESKKKSLFLFVTLTLFSLYFTSSSCNADLIEHDSSNSTFSIGYDKLTLHGKFRRYEVDTTKGDKIESYSDGSPNSCIAMPQGAIKNGIEYPTFWSRLPLSIQPTPASLVATKDIDPHCENGLYSIHEKGTSQIFPKSYNTAFTSREKDANSRQTTSGVYIAFETDSKKIALRYCYSHDKNAGSRAFSGIDIYELDASGTPIFKQTLFDSKFRQDGIFIYDTESSSFERRNKTALLNLGMPTSQKRKFMIMLPTYNGFKFNNCDQKNKSGLTFEFAKNSAFAEIEVFNEKKNLPILIYGTSITQGDGNGKLRPGATYAAQIMFAAKREVLNCGFAGSAQMEYKMADFLANIKSSLFVIDPGWNITASAGNFNSEFCNANGAPANITNAEVVNRAKYMIKKYREKNPTTPIIVCPKFLSGFTTTNAITTCPQSVEPFLPAGYQNNFSGVQLSREGLLLYAAYLSCKNDGIKNLYWAKQDAKISQSWNSENTNYVNCADLHPCARGMSSIATFILSTIASTPELSKIFSSDLTITLPAACESCSKGDHGKNWQ